MARASCGTEAGCYVDVFCCTSDVIGESSSAAVHKGPLSLVSSGLARFRPSAGPVASGMSLFLAG